jgi:hypothetical protein
MTNFYTVEALRIENASGEGASFSISNNKLVIEADAVLDGIEVRTPDGDILLHSPQGKVRSDAERIEVHGDNIVRVDAGGTGYTFTPSHWEYWLPYSGAGWKAAPPEHPDSGGEPYGGATAADFKI